MNANAEILLMRDDGAVILQIRDDKPGITNPGLVSSFGGHIEEGEEPIDAAVREINEETNLGLDKEQLQFYRKCRKTKETHGEDWGVYYFVATNISEAGLEVYEGVGYTIIRSAQELAQAKTSVLLKQVLGDYFDGFRSFVFQDDMPDEVYREKFDEYYAKICTDKHPSTFAKPVALACTGFVAAGKSTVTTPLAESIRAVGVSSDDVRETLFRAGYNFKRVRLFLRGIITKLIEDNYDIFLDFNISTNIDILDELSAAGYQIFVVHANPPEDFIKHKILSGNMKHELTFFPKDEYLYDSFITWKHRHTEGLPRLRERYGIWYEVDTSRKDLADVMQQMQAKFKDDLQLQ